MAQGRNRRREKAEGSRRRILETAIRLFDERGYDKVTVADICREAGFSVGAFYHYFKSKDQVIEERYLPFATQVDSFFKSLSSRAGEKSVSSAEKLRKFTDLLLKYTEEVGVDALRTAYRSQIEPASMASHRLGSLFKPHMVVREIIEEGQRNGEFRSDIRASDITDMLYDFVFGIMYSWCLHGASFSLRKAGRVYLDLILDGLRER